MTPNPKEEVPTVTNKAETFENTVCDKNSLNVNEESREFPANLPGPEYKMELVWRNIIIFIILHILCIINFYFDKKLETKLFAMFYALMSGFGVTAGAHRLFSHNSYKTNTALKVMLLYFQSIAFQNSVFEWSRDHRVHHKYTDTNADPHNVRRGFFFSHMGWLLCKKHPDVFKFGSRVSMADLEGDKYVMFQHRHFLPIMLVASLVIPVFIPCYFWNESFWSSFLFVGIVRYIFTLHITWLINSAAHTYGMKPYDKNISPSDSYLVGFLAIGEGWHNYHHVFPYDYKTSELAFYSFNLTTAFIDFMAWIGWAYNLKTVSADMIRKRACRTGDGSHKYSKEAGKSDKQLIEEFVLQKSVDENGNMIQGSDGLIWGYEDELMTEDDKNCIKVLKQHAD
ncbi:hypothetical protein ACKWTF_016442 [Chironomus riparius]